MFFYKKNYYQVIDYKKPKVKWKTCKFIRKIDNCARSLKSDLVKNKNIANIEKFNELLGQVEKLKDRVFNNLP